MRTVARISRPFVRWQSQTAAPVAAAASSAPTAVSSKAPVLTSDEQEKLGNNVTHSWSRFTMNPADAPGMDITEARKVTVLSEVAENFSGRKAVIYHAHKSAMTSGTAASKGWAIRMDYQNKWANGLMGWQSGTDSTWQPANLLRFESAEQAILYCERNNIAFEVDKYYEHPRGAVDNQYAYNFLPMDTMAKMKAGGPRRATRIFAHPTAPSSTGVSTFVNYRYTQRGTEEWKPRGDGNTYAKGVAQGASAWTGPEWAPAKAKYDTEEEHH